ncbi:MAG TPA: cbb3-type cytochrome c oxidase subunit II [Gemmataceae bacterium]|nr:cbb3-type cytochrome c oxidase subunit II [Gemmataceae bacterium]
MDRGMVIFLGALLTFSSSWLGLVLYPFWQLDKEKPFPDRDRESDRPLIASGAASPDDPYPRPLAGKALIGMRVYQSNGCMYCHTQQVRSEKFGNWWENGEMRTGADIKRGWGTRRTVSRDYLYDNPTMLGTMRTGPDLAAIGPRYSEQWQHAHLFNPRAINSWSIMPSFAFLYRREKITGERRTGNQYPRLGREWTIDPGYRWRPTDDEWTAVLAEQGDAIRAAFRSSPVAAEVADLDSTEARQKLLDFWLTTPEEGYQIVPTPDAEALVEYLLRLNKTEVPLPEAKE